MNSLKDFKNTVFNLLKLTLPILGGNISHILISISDTIIAGRYSTLALGAISVASAIILTMTIGAIGIVLSVSPVVANNRGANIPSKKFFNTTILFSILISIPFFLAAELFISKINLIGLAEELVNPCVTYLKICVWSVFPAAIFVATKEFLQAYENVVFTNILMVITVFLNLILNIVFAFGFDFYFIHIPELGVRGLAIATLISRAIPPVIMLFYCFPLFFERSKKTYEESKKYVLDLIKTGIPISAAMFFEFLGFNLTAVLIGKFSALFAAVHNIILCIANFTFMIALSIGQAASIKVGFYNGKNDLKNIIKYSKACYFSITLVCFILFILIILFQDNIISLFSKDPEVLFLCKKIVKIALCFLFFDGIQCASNNILKGLKDTKTIALTMLAGYMFVAIPFGSILAFKFGIVLEGFWTGLALALFVIAIIATLKVLKHFSKGVKFKHVQK